VDDRANYARLNHQLTDKEIGTRGECICRLQEVRGGQRAGVQARTCEAKYCTTAISACGCALATARLKTEMLAEELHHVILKTIRNLARVSSLVLFETVRDSILVKHVMQFGSVHS
jgi:hypothetical protein